MKFISFLVRNVSKQGMCNYISNSTNSYMYDLKGSLIQ